MKVEFIFFPCGFVCQMGWMLHICLQIIFLKLFFIEPLIKDPTYLVFLGQYLVRLSLVPPFIFPGSYSLRVLPSAGELFMSFLFHRCVFRWSVLGTWCSLSVGSIDRAPQAPECIWNLLSTIFRYVNCHQRD